MKKKFWLVFGSFLLCGVAIAVILLSFVRCSPLEKASKNLTSYAIDVELDENFVISGKQTVSFYNSTGVMLSDICFHLYARAFRKDASIRPYTALNKASCFPSGESFGDILIEKVEVNGEAANFEFAGSDEDILKVNTTSQPKSRMTIYLEYILTLPNCTHRMGQYNGTINLGNWYPIVCYYDGGWQTDPYYSTGDPFVSECANYEVAISYPREYDCFATGNLQNEEQKSEKTSHFSALAVRDFAIFLSNKAKFEIEKVNKTNVIYVGYDGDPDIKQNTLLAARALSYFSKTFGEYPYQNLIVVKSAFLQGGMEYPNIVIVSDAIDDKEELDKVIVHEIAHQWWYGLVGNNQVKDAWLDESLAEYSSCLFFEDNNVGDSYKSLIKDATASYLLYVDVIGSLNKNVNLAMNLAVNEYASEYEYTYMVYVKGIIMLDSLRDAVGKDKLIKAFKKYCKNYSYKIAKPENFVEIVKKTCHKDVDGFFSGWLDGTNVVATTFVSIL